MSYPPRYQRHESNQGDNESYPIPLNFVFNFILEALAIQSIAEFLTFQFVNFWHKKSLTYRLIAIVIESVLV
ncbi:hypothetical protein, partial [Providencia rettgeri]|uniref:hypothetical protein n=1 Tax=Providencia rettgeri TaxID=587 RepID=UPI001AAEA427